MESNVALLVPRTQIKRVKTALEERGWLDRKRKFSLEANNSLRSQPEDARMIIPFIAPYNNATSSAYDAENWKLDLLKELSLHDLSDQIELTVQSQESTKNIASLNNPISTAIFKALQRLPPSLLVSLDLGIDDLVERFPKTYTIYKPMLLLPPNAFESSSWHKLLLRCSPNSDELRPLWETVAPEVGLTHIAINAAIPISKQLESSSEASSSDQDNILRSPINLTPIYGPFGPLPNPQRLSSPTEQDFASAFWVSTTQNGIHQVWAPLYTMFSRGNIREKARVLKLPSVQSAISEGEKGKPSPSNQLSPRRPGCTAVDLYAGIGYFSFSYRKAGVSKVLCWELNPWSIEGLRRGAQRNNWRTHIFKPSTDTQALDGLSEKVHDADIAVFQQTNEEAHNAIAELVGQPEPAIPPVRHVNLGFLPSSRLSWKTAVRIIDTDLGGWIHAHENVGVEDIAKRKDEVVEEMQRHLVEWDEERGSAGNSHRRVRWEHTERIKTYAPGVWHVVFDVWVDGQKDRKD